MVCGNFLTLARPYCLRVTVRVLQLVKCSALLIANELVLRLVSFALVAYELVVLDLVFS